MKVGDLVVWPQGYCDMPGLVLATRPTKPIPGVAISKSEAVLAMLPELGNDPEWFHECELEIVNESTD